MRTLISFVILLLLSATAWAQKTSPPKCELEQLALGAALGDETAQYNLGVEFFSGKIVRQDYAKAAYFWGKVSEAGGVAASNNLGFLKYYGRPGVERDHAEGVRLWRIAAERGFAESQLHLGEAYSDGRFLKTDFIEAYAWAKTSKHNASKMAEGFDNPDIDKEVAKLADRLLLAMRDKLSNAEMVQAEKRAAEYIGRFQPK